MAPFARCLLVLATLSAVVADDVIEGGLIGYFYSNSYLGGAPACVVPQPSIAFNRSHDCLGANTVEFSARWVGALRAPKDGNLTLLLSFDEYYRLWIGGRLVVDAWSPTYVGREARPPGDVRYDVGHVLAGDLVDLQIDYTNRAGPAWGRPLMYSYGDGADLVVPPESLAARFGVQGLKAEYFDNATLQGYPACSGLSGDLGHLTEVTCVTAGGNWSGRWTGFLRPQRSGKVEFQLGLTTDSGRPTTANLWVDNVLIIEPRQFVGNAPAHGSIDLSADSLYPVRLEVQYGTPTFELSLQWSDRAAPAADSALSDNTGLRPIPSGALLSGPAVLTKPLPQPAVNLEECNCTFSPGLDMGPYSAGGQGGHVVHTIAKCCEVCHSSTNCYAWTWNSATRLCQLNPSTTPQPWTANPDVISAVMAPVAPQADTWASGWDFDPSGSSGRSGGFSGFSSSSTVTTPKTSGTTGGKPGFATGVVSSTSTTGATGAKEDATYVIPMVGGITGELNPTVGTTGQQGSGIIDNQQTGRLPGGTPATATVQIPAWAVAPFAVAVVLVVAGFAIYVKRRRIKAWWKDRSHSDRCKLRDELPDIESGDYPSVREGSIEVSVDEAPSPVRVSADYASVHAAAAARPHRVTPDYANVPQLAASNGLSVHDLCLRYPRSVLLPASGAGLAGSGLASSGLAGSAIPAVSVVAQPPSMLPTPPQPTATAEPVLEPVRPRDRTVEDLLRENRRLMIPTSDLDLTSKIEIGSGAYGVAYRVKLRPSGTSVVVKQLKGRRSDESDDQYRVRVEEFRKEMCNVINIRPHPNIVQLLGLVVEDASLSIVMEYLPLGSLRSTITTRRATGKEVKMAVAQKLLREIAMAMGHIHQQDILHCDLAARNVLLALDGSRDRWQAKITDFGLARIQGAQFDQMAVSIRWSSPEVLEKKQFSPASDVWSFGCVIFEVLTQEDQPYSGYFDREVREKVISGELQLSRPSRFADWQADLYDLMDECVRREPARRPAFFDIIKDHLPDREHVIQAVAAGGDSYHDDLSDYATPVQTGAPMADAGYMNGNQRPPTPGAPRSDALASDRRAYVDDETDGNTSSGSDLEDDEESKDSVAVSCEM